MVDRSVDINDQLRVRLLQHARSTIQSHLAGEIVAYTDVPWPELPRCGAFVTLRKSGKLRGCIGVFSAADDLPTTISKMALAAVKDPRFCDAPLSAMEMNDLRIEISLLSPLQKIEDRLAFDLGTHGVYIKQGFRVGCFLPEVATERGWDKETFLTQCCHQKAGLHGLAWKEPETELFVFTVEKLSE